MESPCCVVVGLDVDGEGGGEEMWVLAIGIGDFCVVNCFV
jgi:hypothetical protein